MQMLWIHDSYRSTHSDYDAIASLEPLDCYHAKQGRSTGRYLLPAPEGSVPVYLKKFFRLPWYLRFAPASQFPGPRELENHRHLAALGVAVPEAVAAGASREHLCKSFFVTRELTGYIPLHEFIPARFAEKHDAKTRRLKRRLIVAIADIARRLHQAGYYHRDFYLCHLYILPADDGENFDLVLIDLNRLLKSRRERWRVKDIAALLFSSELPGISNIDRLRFFAAYLGHHAEPYDRQLLRQAIRKSQSYRHHNLRMAA